MTSAAVVALALALGQSDSGVFRNGPATMTVRPAPERGVVPLPAADDLELRVRIVGSAALTVEVPPRWILGRGWRTRPPEPAKLATSSDGKTAVWELRLEAYPTVPGEHTLVLAPATWKDGDRSGEAKFEPIPVRSFSRIERADLRQLRDRAVLEDSPGPPPGNFWEKPILAAIGLACGVLLALRGVRRRPKRSELSETRALRTLDRVNAWNLPERGRGERYLALLSLIVRRHLERRSGVPARRRTAQELRPLFGASGASPEERRLLDHFAERAERAKFGPDPPSIEECRRAEEDVRRLLAGSFADEE